MVEYEAIETCDLIEKDVDGESIHREATLKSPGVMLKKANWQVEQHGIARYSKFKSVFS